MKNIDSLLLDSLNDLEIKISSILSSQKRDHYLIVHLGEFYIQYIQGEKVGTLECEAMSEITGHMNNEDLTAFQTRFRKRGFTFPRENSSILEEQIDNYSKIYDMKNIDKRELVKEMVYIFLNIYLLKKDDKLHISFNS